jgi:hypothetical protein
MVERQGLSESLHCPFRRRVGSDVVMKDPPTAHLQDYEYNPGLLKLDYGQESPSWVVVAAGDE